MNTPSNPVTVGDDETLEATVLDSGSHLQINNAILELVVTDSAGNPIDESSDNDGDLSYTLDEVSRWRLHHIRKIHSYAASLCRWI